jgi:hypothetical protein
MLQSLHMEQSPEQVYSPLEERMRMLEGSLADREASHNQNTLKRVRQVLGSA